jgi:hypothetical protein
MRSRLPSGAGQYGLAARVLVGDIADAVHAEVADAVAYPEWR